MSDTNPIVRLDSRGLHVTSPIPLASLGDDVKVKHLAEDWVEIEVKILARSFELDTAGLPSANLHVRGKFVR